MRSDRLLTVAQVADLLQTTPDTVRRWLREGRIKGVRLGGPRLGYRIEASEVERIIDAGRTQPKE